MNKSVWIFGAFFFVGIPLFLSIFNGVEPMMIFSVVFYFTFLAIYFIKKSIERESMANDNALMVMAQQYIQGCAELNEIPAINTHVNISSDEIAYYQSDAQLHETKSVRTHTAGMVGYRLTKRVFIGGARGQSESTEEWAHIDTGVLVVTGNRLIFDGEKTQRVVPLRDILSIEEGAEGLWVSSEKRTKTMLFPINNPYICSFIIRTLVGSSVASLLDKIGMQVTMQDEPQIEEKVPDAAAKVQSSQEISTEDVVHSSNQNVSDFSEISGVGAKSAELIKATGVSSIEELAQKNPVKFRELLVQTNSSKKIISGNPSLKEVTRWIDVANEIINRKSQVA